MKNFFLICIAGVFGSLVWGFIGASVDPEHKMPGTFWTLMWILIVGLSGYGILWIMGGM